jgi:signal transduction histidine kinase
MPEEEGPRGPTRLFGLPPRVAGGFGAALLALFAAGAALSYAFAARSERGAEMGRSWTARQSLHELDGALAMSATTLDIYLVTGDPSQRLRYGQSASDVSAALEKLGDAIAAPSPQAARRERVARLVRTIQAQEARLAGLRDRGEGRVLEARRQTSAIPAATREIHAIFAEMKAAEAEILRASEDAWRRTVTQTYVVAAGAAIVLFVLLVGAARAVRADIARRERDDADHARMMELQQRLMAIVGHDLRTPLSGIVWNAALLGRSGLGEGDVRLVRRISASARRMERLIRDVLDYGRVHAGAGIPIAPEPADLRAICRGVVDEIHDPAHPVSFAAEGDTTGVWDADRLEQIVANLTANAVKYGPPGRPVWVRVFGEDGTARIEVRDDGGGIPASVQGRLFEPFRVGEGIGGKGSVGLGLFIVRTLAEAHGGTVAVDSTPERGTTFVVRLPRVAPGSGTGRAAAQR